MFLMRLNLTIKNNFNFTTKVINIYIYYYLINHY